MWYIWIKFLPIGLIWLSILVHPLIANAETQAERLINTLPSDSSVTDGIPIQIQIKPHRAGDASLYDDLHKEINILEKRITELEKIIKEHIDKPHVYFGERDDLRYTYKGYLYTEDCNDKQD